MPRRWASAVLTASRVVMPGRISAAMSRTAFRERWRASRMPAIVKRWPTRSQACSWRGGASMAAPAVAGRKASDRKRAGGRPPRRAGRGPRAPSRDCRRRRPRCGSSRGRRPAPSPGRAAAWMRWLASARRRRPARRRVPASCPTARHASAGPHACLAAHSAAARRSSRQACGRPVQRHRCHAPVVQRRHQDGEHARESRAGGQQHQMVRAVV